MTTFLFRVCLLWTTVSFYTAAASHSIGTIPSQPVALTKDNFAKTIQDPKNPLWLLKFYAPWCGHCKKLAPVLERAAEKLTGRMAIGLIDCTSAEGKSLCNDYEISGYPTLKYSVDGTVRAYPMGRSESDILAFGNKMSSLPVQQLNTKDQVHEYIHQNTKDKIAFVVYDPLVSELSKPVAQVVTEPDQEPTTVYEVPNIALEDKMKANSLMQAFSSAARKEQALGHFLLLDTLKAEEALAVSGKANQGDGAYVCRIELSPEYDIPPRCFEGTATPDNLLEFIRDNNIPTVSAWGPRNFQTMGKQGRHLVIGVVDDMKNGDVLQEMKTTLLKTATSTDFGQQYYFGWFQGLRWAKFLEQFSIEDTPQIFVLDVPNRIFWQDASYKYDLERFLKDIADGKVQGRKARRKGVEGIFDLVYDMATENTMAVSIAVMAFLFFLFVRLAYWAASDDDLAVAVIKAEEVSAKKDQ